MGWGNCGKDSSGRSIGYYHEGLCDEPGCNKKIDRGIAYACGDMHGSSEDYCEKYFCSEHLTITKNGQRCKNCHEKKVDLLCV